MSTKIFGDLEVKADLEVKSDLTVQQTISIPAETAGRALTIDADKKLKSSSVTISELEKLSGVTSNVQAQLNDKASQGDMTEQLGLKADASDLTSHIENHSNPHQVTKAQVGLGNVDNTSDLAKPVSNATQTALNEKIDNTQKAAPLGVATLDADGKVPTSQLPALAITDTYVVANAGEMIGLSAQKGDIAIRTDIKKSFILADENPALLPSWKELLTPDDQVTLVNGQSGIVTLGSDDISEGSSNKYFTADRAREAAVEDHIIASEATKAPSQKAVKSALDEKANSSDVTEALSHKANSSDVTTALSEKVDKTTYNADMPLKANANDVTTALNQKVDKSTYDAAMPLKADISYVNGQINSRIAKSDISTDSTFFAPIDTAVPSQKAVKDALDLKANLSYVDEKLGLKANSSDVTTALGLKANSSDVNTALNGKIDKSSINTDSTFEFASNAEVPSTQAVKDAIAAINTSLGETSTAKLSLSGGTMSGDINMDGRRVKNLPAPSSDTDAVSKGWVLSEIAKKDQASEISIDFIEGISSTEVQGALLELTSRTDSLNSQKFDKSGGVISGPLSVNGIASFNAASLFTGPATFSGMVFVPAISAGSPDLSAATKKYVDDKVAGKDQAIEISVSPITGMGEAADTVQGALEDLQESKFNKAGGTISGATSIYANLDMHGNNINNVGSASEYHQAVNYSQLNQVTISPVLTPEDMDVCQFSTAQYSAGMVDYLMTETTSGLSKVGKLMVVHNGSTAEISDIGTETADSGVTFSASVEGGFIKIKCSVPAGTVYSMIAEKKAFAKR